MMNQFNAKTAAICIILFIVFVLLFTNYFDDVKRGSHFNKGLPLFIVIQLMTL